MGSQISYTCEVGPCQKCQLGNSHYSSCCYRSKSNQASSLKEDSEMESCAHQDLEEGAVVLHPQSMRSSFIDLPSSTRSYNLKRLTRNPTKFPQVHIVRIQDEQPSISVQIEAPISSRSTISPRDSVADEFYESAQLSNRVSKMPERVNLQTDSDSSHFILDHRNRKKNQWENKQFTDSQFSLSFDQSQQRGQQPKKNAQFVKSRHFDQPPNPEDSELNYESMSATRLFHSPNGKSTLNLSETILQESFTFVPDLKRSIAGLTRKKMEEQALEVKGLELAEQERPQHGLYLEQIEEKVGYESSKFTMTSKTPVHNSDGNRLSYHSGR